MRGRRRFRLDVMVKDERERVREEGEHKGTRHAGSRSEVQVEIQRSSKAIKKEQTRRREEGGESELMAP